MSRAKKSRKPGTIGKSKSSTPLANGKKPKKHKGLQSGSRNNQEQSTVRKPSGNKAPKDIRHGSKKPVALVPEPKKEVKQPTAKLKKSAPVVLTPEQELEKLENDNRLATLLDKTEAGETLNKADQVYLDKNLARYSALCEELGIDVDEDESDDEPENEWQMMLDEDSE